MSTPRDKAYRRFQHQKMVRRVRKMAKDVWRDEIHLIDSWVKRMAVTPKPCSCYMCGNPRKQFNELTMQEKKHQLEIDEYLNEVEEDSGYDQPF